MGLSNSQERTKRNSLRAERRRATVSTVRDVRERLMSTSGTSAAFDNEILEAFARARMSSSLSMVALSLCVAAAFLLWIDLQIIIAWLSCLLLTQGLMLRYCRKFLNEPRLDAKVRFWRRQFILCDVLQGFCWAAAPLLPTSNSIAFGMVIYAVVLVVLASATLMSYLIPIAMLAATLPLVVSGIAIYLTSGSTQLLYIMASATVVAEVTFILIGVRLYRTSLNMHAYRAEKDAIFGELEQQKVISDEARRHAEDANLAKSRFLATMSHELRTPLNAILGFSEVMKDELLGPIENDTYKDYATDIHNSGRHLLELINEILDLSRIEAGRYKLNEEAVNLLHVADDCHHLIKLRAKTKSIVIHEAFEPELPKLWADERAIRQITLNLLSNAVKFTPQGGEITLTVGWTAGGGQYLSVRDSGPGIPEEEIPIVLAAFGQGSIAHKNAEAGTGLGLPIVQALVGLHGGQFSLQSKLRVGTEVTVAFPRARNLEAIGQISTAQTAGQDKSNGRNAA